MVVGCIRPGSGFQAGLWLSGQSSSTSLGFEHVPAAPASHGLGVRTYFPNLFAVRFELLNGNKISFTGMLLERVSEWVCECACVM